MEKKRRLFTLYSGDTLIAKIQFFGNGHGIDLFGNGDSALNYVVLDNGNYYKCLFEVELTGSKCNIALFIDGIKKASGTYDCSETANDVINVDADALAAKMAEYVDNAAITSLQVGASNIDVALSDITSIKETLNGTDIETKSINAKKGVIFNNMAANPLTGGNWTIQALKDIRFKLTGVKA